MYTGNGHVPGFEVGTKVISRVIGICEGGWPFMGTYICHRLQSASSWELPEDT